MFSVNLVYLCYFSSMIIQMENTQSEEVWNYSRLGGGELLKLVQNLRTCDGVIICNSLQIFELRKEKTAPE